MKLIDLHCDTLLLTMSPDREEQESYLKKNNAMVDIDKLLRGKSLAQFFAIFIPSKNLDRFDFADHTPFEFAQQLHKNYLHELEINKEFIKHANNYQDLLANEKNNLISTFLTIEEGGIIDNRMNRLDELYSMGIRLITLTWNYENCIGYPNSNDDIIMQKGLKPFGIDVVKKMNDLGIIIDVSHLSDGGFWDVVKYSKQPFIASHSNSRSLTRHTRNLTDKMMVAMAASGGLIGINFGPDFIYDKNTSKNDESKVADLVKHIKHIKSIAGIDTISLGSDFDGIKGKLEIQNIGQISKLYTALENEGFNKSELEKIGYKNAMRIIKNVL